MEQSWKQFTGLFADALSAPQGMTNTFADSLLNKEYRNIKNKMRLSGQWYHWSFGLCYVVSECAYYMLGGKEQGWKPMFIRHMGCPHWFLKHEDGTVFDPTAEQFRAPVHYEVARGKGFMTKKPCKRTQILMKRIMGNVRFINDNKNNYAELDNKIEDLILKGQKDAPLILEKLDLLNDGIELEDYAVRDWNRKFYESLHTPR